MGRVFRLSPAAYKRFMAMIDNPPAPTEALVKLMRGDGGTKV